MSLRRWMLRRKVELSDLYLIDIDTLLSLCCNCFYDGVDEGYRLGWKRRMLDNRKIQRVMEKKIFEEIDMMKEEEKINNDT